jgi:hypothetical protein
MAVGDLTRSPFWTPKSITLRKSLNEQIVYPAWLDHLATAFKMR